MTLSTASRTLWTMNPSRMSYRDHRKSPSSIFPYTYVIFDILHPYNTSMSTVQEFIYHPAMECATPQSCRVVASFGRVWFLSLVVGVVARVPSL